MRRLMVAAAIAGLVVAGVDAQAAEMRISHQLPPAHHIAKLVDAFASDVQAATNGEVEVKIFGASQLAKPNENFPGVAKGAFEAAISVNFQWGNTIPEMNLMVIPYFFTDLGKLERFPGSPAAALLEDKLLAKGVRNIAWLYTTRQSIFTSGQKPIVAVEDFQGLKVRGLNKLADEALIAVGAAPTAMPGDEVYQALQTGVIDAGLTDVSAAYSRKYYEVQKYGTVAPYFSVYFHLYVNPAWWDGLSDAQRAAIAAAARKAEAEAIPLVEKTAEEAIEQLKASGMTLHIQSDEEAAAWKAKMQPPVIEAFVAEGGDDAKKLIEAIDAL